MNVLLDSVVVIDYLNGFGEARTYVDTNQEEAALSAITVAEVLVGTEEEGVPATLRFLDAFPLLGINRATAIEAARLRRRYGWRLPDAFQAALARRHDLQLATRNTRDFDPEAHGFVIVPYRL